MALTREQKTMSQTDDTELRTLAELIAPLARLMIHSDISLPTAVELLKSALVDEAFSKDPDASVSHVSLMTGVHRKDIKRLEVKTAAPPKSSAAARVVGLWAADPDYQSDGAPRVLERDGDIGFDALVRKAKVDAAPATVLSLLIEAGSVVEKDGQLTLLTRALVPSDRREKLQVAAATLVPHLDTTIGNLIGNKPQLDQALRYSHLSQAASDQLTQEAARLATDMLQQLNILANRLQAQEEGKTLFVAGAYIHAKEADA